MCADEQTLNRFVRRSLMFYGRRDHVTRLLACQHPESILDEALLVVVVYQR